MSEPTADEVPAATPPLGDAALEEVSGGLWALECPRCGREIYSGHSC
jgi:hypothetical protein